MGANSLCNVCKNMGLNLSSPAAFTSSISIQPVEKIIYGDISTKR